ncbi:MAG: Hsp20/alpha crystallin family protein [Chloroflexi bacterium]|nr:Hsp20/alpha crystallin family protein [Chloroflexota bacterium]
MSALIRWEPFRPVTTLRDAMDHLFEDSFLNARGWMAPTFATEFAMDLYETKDHVVVQATLPGVKPDDVEITIAGNTLTIRGETQQETEIKQATYHRRERRVGSFTRCVMLPAGLESAKAEAEFENGVLTLRVPKSEEIKPKTVKVKTK